MSAGAGEMTQLVKARGVWVSQTIANFICSGDWEGPSHVLGCSRKAERLSNSVSDSRAERCFGENERGKKSEEMNTVWRACCDLLYTPGVFLYRVYNE